MEFPVSDIIEQSVTKQVNAMVGNSDINLNTIVKMATLNEMRPLGDEKVRDVLQSINLNNKLESFWYEKELVLTLDSSGNIVSKDNINEALQDNSGSQLPEPRPGQ